MIQNVLSSGNRLIFVGLLLCCSLSVDAQRKPPSRAPGTSSFLDTQWWLGIKAGTVMAQAVIEGRQYVFSPINYESQSRDKDYQTWGSPGLMTGIDIIFYHKGFSIGLQPVYKKLQFHYQMNQEWLQPDATTALISTLDVTQSLHYLEVPFLIKYDVLQSGKVRPFVQVGWQQSFLLDAQKDATLNYSDFASDPTQNYQSGQFSIGNERSFQHFSSAIGGLGVNLDYLNIRTILEASYHVGLNPISASKNPYDENELVSLGDVQDEVSLRQISLSVSFVFPLRYIDRTFSPY